MKQRFKYLLIVCSLTFSMNSCEFIRDLTAPVENNRNSKDKLKEKDATTKIDAETRLRENLTEESRKHIGTKYKYAGKVPSTGFDCSGFTSYVYKKHDKQLSSSSSAQSKQGKKIPLKNVKPGDLVFFSRNGKTIMHVALVVSNTSEGINVIHSTTSKGVIIQNISKSNYWKPKILFARDVLSD
jgi:cell wall-associated NlpC family hydrolase